MMLKFKAVLVIIGTAICITTEALPAPATEVPPLIYFQDGKLGVNFFGFHAAAGFNNLLNGGGLHAEAGTPFGQRAAAGLSGALARDGSAGGNLYAGATAGGNVKAAAGLGGAVVGGDSSKAAGNLYSAASAGPAKSGSTLAGGISDEGSFKVVERIGNTRPQQVESSNEVVATKAKTAHVNADNHLRKTVHIRGHPVKFNKFFVASNAGHSDQTAHQAPAVSLQKEVQFSSRSSVSETHNNEPNTVRTKFVSYQSAPPSSLVTGGSDFLNAFLAPHPAVQSRVDVQHSVQYDTGHDAQHNGQRQSSFFDDIFNIPISTLGAVSRFLSNTVPAKSGVVHVDKTVTTF